MPYVFDLRQRFTPMQNRYDLIGYQDGAGRVFGYAEQKRMALKEKITFYATDDKRDVAFTLHARNMLDLIAKYDVVAGDGTPLALISRDAVRSILRMTYRIETPNGRKLVGQRHHLELASIRRNREPWLQAWQFHVSEQDRVLVKVVKSVDIRDVYRVEVLDDSIDWRVSAAIATVIDVAMDHCQ